MKSLQVLNLKTIVLRKVMYTMIHRYDEQAFDMSEESEKKNFIVKEIVAACSKSGHG